MKITIVNCYDDSNKGSSAILWGLIRRLQRTGIVDRISLVSMFESAHPLFASAFRHIKTGFPDIVTVGSPLPSTMELLGDGSADAAKVKVRSNASRLLNTAGAWMKLGFGISDNGFATDAVREIRTSDLVVERGGPFFGAKNPVINLSLYNFAYPLLLARKIKVPFGLAPGSSGPFRSTWSRRFIRKLFSDAAFITVRDEISRRELESCGIESSRIAVTLDSAFWVEPRVSPRVIEAMQARRLEQGRFLVVTTRKWYPEVQQRYHAELAKMIDELVPGHFDKAVLVANVVGPKGLAGGDRQVTEELFQLIHQKEHVSILDEDLGPDELVGLYGQARVVLGTRLHSVIMALAGGTPAVAVAYVDKKTQGVMELLGLGEYALELETFRSERGMQLVLSAEGLRDEIATKVEKLRQEGDAIFRAAVLSQRSAATR